MKYPHRLYVGKGISAAAFVSAAYLGISPAYAAGTELDIKTVLGNAHNLVLGVMVLVMFFLQMQEGMQFIFF